MMCRWQPQVSEKENIRRGKRDPRWAPIVFLTFSASLTWVYGHGEAEECWQVILMVQQIYKSLIFGHSVLCRINCLSEVDLSASPTFTTYYVLWMWAMCVSGLHIKQRQRSCEYCISKYILDLRRQKSKKYISNFDKISVFVVEVVWCPCSLDMWNM